jgi:hypothetical protein
MVNTEIWTYTEADFAIWGHKFHNISFLCNHKQHCKPDPAALQ